MHEPVSIVIPSLNAPQLEHLLDSLKSQRYDAPIEIIVVGQVVPKIVSGYSATVTFILTETPVNAASARNRGIKACSFDQVLFIDDDCIPIQDWVFRMVTTLEEGWDVVGGGVDFESKSFLPLVYNLSMLHEFFSSNPVRQVKYLPTLNLAVKKAVINSVGLLDEAFARAQDLEWTLRISGKGFRMVFDPQASVLHQPVVAHFSRIWQQFERSGFFSILARTSRNDFSNLLSLPIFWIIFSPAIALFITSKIFFANIQLWKFLYTFPAIFLTKVAWCKGASRSLAEHRRRQKHERT